MTDEPRPFTNPDQQLLAGLKALRRPDDGRHPLARHPAWSTLPADVRKDLQHGAEAAVAAVRQREIITAAVTAASAELEKLHQQALDKVRAEFDQRIAALEAELKENHKEKLAAQRKRLQTAADDKARGLTVEHETAIRELTAEYGQEIARLKTELRRTRRAHIAEMQDLTQAFEQKVHQLEEKVDQLEEVRRPQEGPIKAPPRTAHRAVDSPVPANAAPRPTSEGQIAIQEHNRAELARVARLRRGLAVEQVEPGTDVRRQAQTVQTASALAERPPIGSRAKATDDCAGQPAANSTQPPTGTPSPPTPAKVTEAPSSPPTNAKASHPAAGDTGLAMTRFASTSADAKLAERGAGDSPQPKSSGGASKTRGSRSWLAPIAKLVSIALIAPMGYFAFLEVRGEEGFARLEGHVATLRSLLEERIFGHEAADQQTGNADGRSDTLVGTPAPTPPPEPDPLDRYNLPADPRGASVAVDVWGRCDACREFGWTVLDQVVVEPRLSLADDAPSDSLAHATQGAPLNSQLFLVVTGPPPPESWNSWEVWTSTSGQRAPDEPARYRVETVHGPVWLVPPNENALGFDGLFRTSWPFNLVLSPGQTYPWSGDTFDRRLVFNVWPDAEIVGLTWTNEPESAPFKALADADGWPPRTTDLGPP